MRVVEYKHRHAPTYKDPMTEDIRPERDLFGLFDLIALNRKEVLYVQVKSNTPGPHYKFQEFVDKFPAITAMQMVLEDRKGWKIWKYQASKPRLLKTTLKEF